MPGDLDVFAKPYKLTAAETRLLKYLLQPLSTQKIDETLQISSPPCALK